MSYYKEVISCENCNHKEIVTVWANGKGFAKDFATMHQPPNEHKIYCYKCNHINPKQHGIIRV